MTFLTVEMIGTLLGIAYLYFEYKADIKMWPIGILMASFYVYIFLNAQIYAYVTIQIYYIIAGIWGWIQWKKEIDISTTHNHNNLFKYTPYSLYLPLIIIIIVIYLFLILILYYFTDSRLTYTDSLVTALSIVAMWMLIKKYIEQWILLILVNILSIYLSLHQGLYFTTALYFIYTIASIFGYFRWKQLVHKKENSL